MAKKQISLLRYGQWKPVAKARGVVDAQVHMHKRPPKYRLLPEVEQHADFLRERSRKRNKMNMGQKIGISIHKFTEQKTNPKLNKKSY